MVICALWFFFSYMWLNRKKMKKGKQNRTFHACFFRLLSGITEPLEYSNNSIEKTFCLYVSVGVILLWLSQSCSHTYRRTFWTWPIIVIIIYHDMLQFSKPNLLLFLLKQKFTQRVSWCALNVLFGVYHFAMERAVIFQWKISRKKKNENCIWVY